jgi:anti-anti-sigma factor
MEPLRVTLRRVHNACVLQVAGDLTLGPELPQLMEQAQAAIRQHRPVGLILDLARTAVVDSAGLGEIVSVYMVAVENRTNVAVLGAPPKLARLFLMTRLDGILPNYATEAAALKAVCG